MGLHDSLLNVPERLRVWQMAGVQHFYLSPGTETSQAVETPVSLLLDPASWPEPWPSFLAKAPARPRFLLTYLELGYDLTGRADARRGQLWRRLIGELGLSGQNAVAFWPLAVPVDGVLTPMPLLFLSGCHLLQPGTIVFFGQSAKDSLAEAQRNMLPAPDVVLPAPADLLADDAEALAYVVRTLVQT